MNIEEVFLNAKSPEELIVLAKDNGINLSAEKAESLFERFSNYEGELSMEELENVAGGKQYDFCPSCRSDTISVDPEGNWHCQYCGHIWGGAYADL